MRLLTFLAALCLATPCLAALNEGVFLDAIKTVENTPDWGRAGERGPYQLIPSVCRVVGGHDRAAALRWLRIVEAGLKARHVDVNVTNAALCWNAGIRAATSGRAPMASYDYSIRVRNIYLDNLASKPISRLTTPVFRLSFAP